ncbi:MAG: hypothetical protein WBP93_09970 [Pyrinomonadaceae bacterium]
MKRALILPVTLLFLLSLDASAQTRRRTTTSRRGRAAAEQKTPALSSRAQAASQLSEQIKSIARFLYLFGPISRELASSDAAAQSNPQGSSQTMERNKVKLREAFHAYRVKMDELENLFSTSQELRPFYPGLLGIASSAGAAEDQITANRYEQAGRSLLDVLNRMTDVLRDLR